LTKFRIANPTTSTHHNIIQAVGRGALQLAFHNFFGRHSHAGVRFHAMFSVARLHKAPFSELCPVLPRGDCWRSAVTVGFPSNRSFRSALWHSSRFLHIRPYPVAPLDCLDAASLAPSVLRCCSARSASPSPRSCSPWSVPPYPCLPGAVSLRCILLVIRCLLRCFAFL